MSPRQKAVVSAGVYLTSIVGVLTLCTVVMHIGVAYADIYANKAGVAENREEIGSLKVKVNETHTDVKWIVDTMKKEHP